MLQGVRRKVVSIHDAAFATPHVDATRAHTRHRRERVQ